MRTICPTTEHHYQKAGDIVIKIPWRLLAMLLAHTDPDMFVFIFATQNLGSQIITKNATINIDFSFTCDNT